MAPLVAIFLGFSTLLGRIYFLKYFETVGIPASDVLPNIIDYAVISPDVTILGVGISIVPAFVVWGLSQVRPKPRNSWGRIGTGAILILTGLTSFAVLHLSPQWGIQPEPGLGVYGIWWILSASAIMFGSAIGVSGVSVKTAEATNPALSAVFERVILSILVWVIIVLIVLYASYQSNDIAMRDAERALRDAPKASIKFTSSGGHEFLHSGLEDYDGDPSTLEFRVILIGDRFVYLGPTSLEVPPDASPIYAIPTRDIASIFYFPKRDGR